MPGDEVGDRVHNFFAQENLSQNQHCTQVTQGNWPLQNNNNWVSNQRQIDVERSKLKNYETQQSDLERGRGGHSLQLSHGLNSTHPTLRSEVAKSQSNNHHQHPNLNGYMYGHQGVHTRGDETNFLGVDTESDHNNRITRGFSMYASSQGSNPEHPSTSVRMESSESPVSFDLFGGQQQMGAQHHGMLQSLPHQQSEFSDVQLKQQLVMLRRVQELQRQKELMQSDARLQSSVDQVPSIATQASSNHSLTLVKGTPISDASNNPWATEVAAGNANRLHRASQAMQGSSSGVVLSPQLGHLSCSVGLALKQVDQSLYGVPVSSLRGGSNQYLHVALDKPSQQMTPYSNSFQVKQHSEVPEQVSMQDGSLISRQGVESKFLFRHNSGQGPNSGFNMESGQQLNSFQRNVPVQEFQGRLGIVGPSEISKDRTAEASSSQNSVALDPTEEKILFGSDDDSIWDAFGKSTDMSGGTSNLVDGGGFINSFPSVQSGSWSALMQSAVAETSSSDLMLQEEWNGLSIQNSVFSTDNQPKMYNDSGKHQTSLGVNSMQITSAFAIRSDLPCDGVNLKNNSRSSQGFQQFGINISQGHTEGLNDNSSQHVHQPAAVGRNWLNRGNQISRPDVHSVDVDMNGKGNSRHWTPQQSGFSKSYNKPNNLNVADSGTSFGYAPFNHHENEKSMHKSQEIDQKQVMHENMSNRDGVGQVSSVHNSAVELEQLRSTMGSSQVIREGSGMCNAAAGANSSNSRANEEVTQFLANSHHFNNWKLVNSSVLYQGSDRLGKSHNPVSRGSQLLNSLNSSGQVKMHEMQPFNNNANLNDSYHSNLPHRPSSIGLKENVLDVFNSRIQEGEKKELPNQVGRKPPVSRKFQYHPMGNLDEDVEPAYQFRQATHSQAMPLHNAQGFKIQDQRLLGSSKPFGQIPKSSNVVGKGEWADQVDTKRLDKVPESRGVLPGYKASMSGPFDRSVGMIALANASQSSQNMLELIHKVDQSKELGSGMHFSSSECHPLSETAEAENSVGSDGGLQQRQPSAQGFGLQLAPPSQLLSVSNHVSQSPSAVNYPASSQATSERGDKGHNMLSSTTSNQLLPSSCERSQGEFKNNKKVFPGKTSHEASLHKTQGNSVFNSGFPYSRSQLQNRLIAGAREEGSLSRSIDMPFDKHGIPPKQVDNSCTASTGQSAEASFPSMAHSAPYDTVNLDATNSPASSINYSHERTSAEKTSPREMLSVSQPFAATGISQQVALPKKLPNLWTSISGQQQILRAQARQVQPKFSQAHQSDVVESTSSTLKILEDQDENIRELRSMHSHGFVCGEEQMTKENPRQQVSFQNIGFVQKMNEAQKKESIIQHLSDASPANSASTQRDIEAFGRSLKPNNFLQHNYSLLNQVRAMKNVEDDPSNRILKRPKGPNSIPLDEQVASTSEQPKESHNDMVEDVLVSHPCVPSGDPKILGSSESDVHLEMNASSQLGNPAPVRVEQPKIPLQMTPSWFGQYGTFKNGQILQIYGAQNSNTVKIVEHPFTLGNSSSSLNALNSVEHVDTDTNQNGTLQSSISVSHTVDKISPPQLLPSDNIDQTRVVVRPKKRKAANELLSWHKEVLQAPQDLYSMSMAERDWSKSTNQLSEKVEDDIGAITYGLRHPRARRRVILTTQLMQLLFRAPPAVILSVDAVSNYESLAYFVARLALGDACSLVSSLKSYSEATADGPNLQADKIKSYFGIDERHLLRVLEDCTGRARKLENSLLRLDKMSSILDLRVECQEIEKISVINRFAMFHGRGQADVAETYSSTDALIALKSFPQKYVTAVPSPRDLPDRVHCLSL